MDSDTEVAITTAEKKIWHVLMDLCADYDLKIEHVQVDTRNFANLAVEITAERQRAA